MRIQQFQARFVLSAHPTDVGCAERELRQMSDVLSASGRTRLKRRGMFMELRAHS